MLTVDSRAKNFLTQDEVNRFLSAAREGRHGVRDYLMGLMAYRHGFRVTELIRVRLDDIDLSSGRLFVRRLKGSMSTSHPMQGDEVRAVRAWLRVREKQISRRRRYCRNGATRGSDGEHRGGGMPPSFSSASGVELNAARNGEGITALVHTHPSPCTEIKPAGSDLISSAVIGGSAERRAVSSSYCSDGRGGTGSFIKPSEKSGTGSDESTIKTASSASPLLFVNERGRRFARQGVYYLFSEIGRRAGLVVYPHMLRHSCGYALANKGCDTRLVQDYLGHKNIQHTERYTRTAASRFERLW